MKGAPLSRRDRLRHLLADLRMPGALEALDAILQGVDGGTLTAPEAIEQLLTAQTQLRNNRRLQAAMRSSRLPVVKQLHDFDFTFQPSLRREQMESLQASYQTMLFAKQGALKSASDDRQRKDLRSEFYEIYSKSRAEAAQPHWIVGRDVDASNADESVRGLPRAGRGTRDSGSRERYEYQGEGEERSCRRHDCS